MSENQTKQGQVFRMTDTVSQLWCWTGSTGFQLVHPIDKKSQIWSESSQWMSKETKEMALNSKPRWVRTKQSKVRCSSWLTESANYGLEPVEPVSNLSIPLIKNPIFGQKLPNEWASKQKKWFSIQNPDQWEPTKARSGVPRDWQSPITMVLNWLNRFSTRPTGW